jgi:molybdopterin-containing oxidoreductase family iron-sulfur binding subunit
MGASMALAGLTACTRQPEEKIVPYVRAPEEVVPGRPLFFATAVLDRGHAKGVLVESHMGRPTKVEGNPEHPASLGATDAFGQAEVLRLYDPDRSQTLKHLGEIRSWGAFLAAAKGAADAQRAVQGAGLRILTETVTSPTLAAQVQQILRDMPRAKWHQWEPDSGDNARAGALLAFGEPVVARPRLDAADVVLSLDADFIGSGPANLRLIREFTSRRTALKPGETRMSRLYAVECSVSLTGSAADHRLAVRPSQVEPLARAIAAALGLPVGGGSSDHPGWVAAVAKDLQRAGAAALVLAGDSQPPAVHALAHLVNGRLGSAGRTVVYTDPPEHQPVDQLASLKELAADMRAGRVDLLVILGANPVYTAPADLKFSEALDKVPIRVHHGLYEDETSELCHWHVPSTHSLESWSDARAFDGTATVMQPLIAPLYDGARSGHEVLAAFTARPERAPYDLVREHWTAQMPAGDFERQWQRAVHDGIVPDTALPEKTVAARAGDWASSPAQAAAAPAGMEIVFRLDPTVGDGRFANNGWLQELPKPLTKLTWDNAALVSPKTAERLGVSSESTSRGSRTDLVELRYRGRTVTAPAWIVPGHPDDVVTVHLGYGRRRAGRVGNGAGFDAYAMRTSDAPWFGGGLEVRRSGERYTLACTQDHWSMEGRAPVRHASLEDYGKNPAFAAEMGEPPRRELVVYPEYKYEGHAWGMAIDLNSCVGCNACVVACQAENNIPVVGKEQVARGREMHWLRIDRYYSGGLDAPAVHHQPMLCMHCEAAPCEVVCPVAATVHSDEGLNDMVYNRCIGTRYCSNNCPYKVRRFNFFLYSDWDTPSLKMLRNPDVTVRSRGVMEKCTYCVQRINHARVEAARDNRPMRDGEITTACQQACPAQAITFGDINDPSSRVARLKTDPRNYGVLEELNTRPRTTYLASVRNPNPELPDV